MELFPSSEAFVRQTREGNVIPVYTRLMADGLTPVSVYAGLRESRPAFLLESVTGGEHIGRYSFIGSSPREILSASEKTTTRTRRDGATEEFPTPEDPLRLLEEQMAAFRYVEPAGLPPFTGGAVGFAGHEYIHCIEPTVPRAAEDVLGMPVIYFALMDSVVAFDHACQQVWVICNVHTDEHATPEAAYKVGCECVRHLCGDIASGASLPVAAPMTYLVPEVPRGNFTREAFEACVNKCKEYICSGDIIQVVASQRLEKPYKAQPLDLYRALRIINPSPYMFILETGDFSVVGASPEVHVRSTHGHVEIRPIAGTRPRGKDEAEDAALEAELLSDPKEMAEHLMLVDLARNDIGRVCETGSVTVKDFAIIERYSHVMHIVSQVEGQLAPEQNAFDLLRATFPAGTLSGAPKIRAMQIISEMERQQRGVYGGALGYFSYNGNLDSCITIRTALIKDETIYVQSGAGLVADSVPEHEYMETVNKAKGMLNAIALSENLTEVENSAVSNRGI